MLLCILCQIGSVQGLTPRLLTASERVESEIGLVPHLYAHRHALLRLALQHVVEAPVVQLGAVAIALKRQLGGEEPVGDEDPPKYDMSVIALQSVVAECAPSGGLHGVGDVLKVRGAVDVPLGVDVFTGRCEAIESGDLCTMRETHCASRRIRTAGTLTRIAMAHRSASSLLCGKCKERAETASTHRSNEAPLPARTDEVERLLEVTRVDGRGIQRNDFGWFFVLSGDSER